MEQVGISLFVKSLRFRVIVIPGMGKGFLGAERTMRKGMGSWWRDKLICRSRTVPMLSECRRVLSHIHSPDRQHQLAVEFGHDGQSSSMGSADIAFYCQASHEAGLNMGGSQEKDFKIVTKQLKEDGFAAVDPPKCE